MAMTIWIVEERLSKRHRWNPCDVMPTGKRDAEVIASHYRERAADWTEREYRVAKYVREESSK